MNEVKAFSLLKKADRKSAFRDEQGRYWVSDGYFVFKTANIASLLTVGLIGIDFGIIENNDSIEKTLSEGAEAAHEYQYTGIKLENMAHKKYYDAALLQGDAGYVAVDDRYLKLFYKLGDDVKFTNPGSPYKNLCVWRNGEIEGVIAPVRLSGEGLKIAEGICKSAPHGDRLQCQID